MFITTNTNAIPLKKKPDLASNLFTFLPNRFFPFCFIVIWYSYILVSENWAPMQMTAENDLLPLNDQCWNRRIIKDTKAIDIDLLHCFAFIAWQWVCHFNQLAQVLLLQSLCILYCLLDLLFYWSQLQAFAFICLYLPFFQMLFTVYWQFMQCKIIIRVWNCSL